MALTSVHCKIQEEEIVSSFRIQMTYKKMVQHCGNIIIRRLYTRWLVTGDTSGKG